MAPSLHRRQALTSNTNNDDGWWWYSETAVIVKWAIIASILVLFLIFFVGGYYHAQRRMKKGLPPLAYHRWLLPRRQRARFDPHLAERYQYQPPQTYNLNQYPPPPPAYNPDEAPLPKYAPPDGSSKVNPDQTVREVPPNGESSHSVPTAPLPAYSNEGNYALR